MAGFQEGMKVVIFPGGYDRDEIPQITKVARVTKTKIVTENGGEFTARGTAWGHSGDRWNRGSWIQEATDENLSVIERKKQQVVARRITAIETIRAYLEYSAADLHKLESIAADVKRWLPK